MFQTVFMAYKQMCLIIRCSLVHGSIWSEENGFGDRTGRPYERLITNVTFSAVRVLLAGPSRVE